MTLNNQMQPNSGSILVTADLALQDIVFITDTNFKLLQPEWLENEELMLKLKGYVFEIVQSGNTLDSMDCFEHLQKLLTQNPRLAQNRPDILMEYLRMLAILKSTFLMNLPEGDIEAFFRENLLFCLDVQDFDLGEQVYLLLGLYRKDTKEFVEFKMQIQRAVESNREFLGENQILLLGENRTVYPTVANWLLDYKQFSVSFSMASRAEVLSRRGGTLGGSLERVSYLQKNPNARNLTKDEKVILFKLLEFYDWIRSAKPTPQYIPFFSSYVQIENFELPGKVLETNEPLLPPVVPAPKGVLPQRPMEEVKKISNIQVPISNEEAGDGGQIPNNKFQISNEEIGAIDRKLDALEARINNRKSNWQ